MHFKFVAKLQPLQKYILIFDKILCWIVLGCPWIACYPEMINGVWIVRHSFIELVILSKKKIGKHGTNILAYCNGWQIMTICWHSKYRQLETNDIKKGAILYRRISLKLTIYFVVLSNNRSVFPKILIQHHQRRSIICHTVNTVYI